MAAGEVAADDVRVHAARAEFPHVDEGIFLQHAAVGRLSLSAANAVTQMARQMTTLQLPDARALADELRFDLARMLAAGPEQIGITRSTAHAITIVARGLDWHPGDNVVGLQYEYPANVLPWMALGHLGVEYRQAKPEPERVIASILALIDQRTRLVTLSDVPFWSGVRVDLPALAEACHRRGVLLVADVMQSVGALRVDIQDLGVDFVAAGDCKWLMGPAGIAFFWASERLIDRLPPLIWGPGGMRDRDEYFDPDLDPAPTARRFEESWLSLLDIAGMHAAVQLYLDVGPDWVEQRVLEVATRLARGCAELGWRAAAGPSLTVPRTSGIVAIEHPKLTSEAAIERLRAANIHATSRAGYLRLSAHYYTTGYEIDRVTEALAAL